MDIIIRKNKAAATPLYEQIKQQIMQGIKKGDLKLGQKLPSINTICQQNQLAAGTVVKAYEDLRKIGLIKSKQGKGYYISGTNTEVQKRIFLLFDRLNAYKEVLYYSFIQALQQQAVTEVFFHHYDLNLLHRLICDNLGQYTHYVVMPHFDEDVSIILQKIPSDQLYLLDKMHTGLPVKAAVYQDFYLDIKLALQQMNPFITKYAAINLIKSTSQFQYIPGEITRGFIEFCQDKKLQYEIIDGYDPDKIIKEKAYLVFPDNELVDLLKLIRHRGWQLGGEIGVVSYDDTPMKEILAGGISVISTDFYQMGQSMAQLILNDQNILIPNPSKFIQRNSL
ncbi:MAG: GntR family transcriptional regulator [Candidatus Cyclobacteriaceae bacterium M3_2C_046]